MKRAELLKQATGLVRDAIDQCNRVDLSRLPTARAVLLEATRAHMIIATAKRLTARRNLEICARFVRADLMTQALQRPLQ